MTKISTLRKTLVLAALALGGFGIGVTEFVTMGLLPQLAADLLPELWAESEELANSKAGWLISAYAFGVVVGAPLITLITARWPKRALIVTMLSLLTITNTLVVTLPGFELVLLFRFIAGLPHGIFFGVATIIASRVLGPNTMSISGAIVLGGLTVANMIGVPIATGMGQMLDWRVAYLFVGVIFLITTVSVYLSAPSEKSDPEASVKREFRAFKQPQVWMTVAMGAIGFGGFFAIYSYIAPLTTNIVLLPESTVPWVLFVTGLGMTIGNLVGGRLGDISTKWTITASFSLVAALVLIAYLTLSPGTAVLLFVMIGLFGAASSMIGPPMQARLMHVSPGSETIAAASHHAAFNMANGLGAYLGGLVVAVTLNYMNTFLLALVLTLSGVVLAYISFWVMKPAPGDDRSAFKQSSNGSATTVAASE